MQHGEPGSILVDLKNHTAIIAATVLGAPIERTVSPQEQTGPWASAIGPIEQFKNSKTAAVEVELENGTPAEARLRGGAIKRTVTSLYQSRGRSHDQRCDSRIGQQL